MSQVSGYFMFNLKMKLSYVCECVEGTLRRCIKKMVTYFVLDSDITLAISHFCLACFLLPSGKFYNRIELLFTIIVLPTISDGSKPIKFKCHSASHVHMFKNKIA